MSEVLYSIDTNAILTARYQTYRPENFQGFWKRLEELIAAGRAFACEDVIRELEKKDDDAHQWAKDQSGFSVPLEEKQIALVKELAKSHPALAKERLGRMRADGFVIALAQWKGMTVVTSENHRGPDKIPNICDECKIPCISLADQFADIATLAIPSGEGEFCEFVSSLVDEFKWAVEDRGIWKSFWSKDLPRQEADAQSESPRDW